MKRFKITVVPFFATMTLLLYVVMAISLPILFIDLSNQSHENQQVSAHANDGLVAVICHVEHFELKNPKIPASEKVKAVKFWNQTLRIIHEPPCR